MRFTKAGLPGGTDQYRSSLSIDGKRLVSYQNLHTVTYIWFSKPVHDPYWYC